MGKKTANLIMRLQERISHSQWFVRIPDPEPRFLRSSKLENIRKVSLVEQASRLFRFPQGQEPLRGKKPLDSRLRGNDIPWEIMFSSYGSRIPVPGFSRFSSLGFCIVSAFNQDPGSAFFI